MSEPRPPVAAQLPRLGLNTKGLKPFGYNPSIIRYQGRLLLSYRWHEAGAKATRLRLAELSEAGDVSSDAPIQCSGSSCEDARLFLHRDGLWMSWVDANYPAGSEAVMKYGRLALGREPAIEETVQVDYAHNDYSRCQKNWIHFDHAGRLYCFYDDHTLLRLEDGKVVEETAVEPPPWAYGQIRGGTGPLPCDGKLLRFFHSCLHTEPEPCPRLYRVGALLLEPEPPFRVVAVSSQPILHGSGLDSLTVAEKAACTDHRRNVVFPCGAVVHEDGWLLAVGANDCESLLLKVRREDLHL